MTLNEAITKIQVAAEKLKSSTSGNEANTKALLIEPLLAALGWDLSDLDAVEREVKVYEGTYLDYALKVSSESRVYLEAKSVTGNLDDKKFVAQTVNYANNDGVRWCVLTNGLRYRVYKTNEPVAMDQKMLFQVDLNGDSEPMSERARLLRLISREAVENGNLDVFGERVFTDARVRQALSDLATKPTEGFFSIVRKQLGHPTVPNEVLHRSLARVLDAPSVVSAHETAAVSTQSKKEPVGPAEPPKGQEYELDHHLGNKGSLIRELWEAIDGFASSLGGDVTRRVRKFYIGYFRGKKSFFTTEVQKGRVLLYLTLSRDTAEPWNEAAMRDAANIGHFGMGDIEYSLVTIEQLEEAQRLVRQAYEQRAAAN